MTEKLQYLKWEEVPDELKANLPSHYKPEDKIYIVFPELGFIAPLDIPSWNGMTFAVFIAEQLYKKREKEEKK